MFSWRTPAGADLLLLAGKLQVVLQYFTEHSRIAPESAGRKQVIGPWRLP